jgi:hypothetical protein
LPDSSIFQARFCFRFAIGPLWGGLGVNAGNSTPSYLRIWPRGRLENHVMARKKRRSLTSAAAKQRARKRKSPARRPQRSALFSEVAEAKGAPGGYDDALRLLWAAYHDALKVGSDPIEFAVELGDFLLLGITRSDLRRLVSQGHAQHLADITPARAPKRRLQRIASLHFTDLSSFMLTEAGVGLARKRHSSRLASIGRVKPTRRRPHWDGGARELWFGKTLVKRFRQAAPNQERILSAFQEENWPAHIDDPLPPREGLNAKRRLHDTVNHLNQHQQSPLLHFRGNGSGTGVCWGQA